MNNLRVFIASSSESKVVAEKISKFLKREFLVEEWFGKSIFSLSETPIESLEKLKNEFDAIVVVSNFEDKIIKRDETLNAIRDNLVFEFALGIGYFGRENSILVLPNNNEPKAFPSDIIGMTFLFYDEKKDGLNSIENISKQLIWNLKEVNVIKYPESGHFGVNILHEDLNTICSGQYSFCARVPFSKKLQIHISSENGVSFGWNVTKKYGICTQPPDENGIQKVTNVPINGKVVDAEISIFNHGTLKIEYFENCKIIKTREIEVK